MTTKYFKFLLLLLPLHGHAQTDGALTKAGGFIYLYHLSEYSGFSLNIERENTFKSNAAFSHGARLDYNKFKPFPKTNFPGNENLILGYHFKLYPFFPKSKRQFNGLFLGIEPCYFVKVNSDYRYGPGLGGLLGYQLWIKNKFTLSAEGNIFYIQNINDNTTQQNPQDRYFYMYASIKVGFKL